MLNFPGYCDIDMVIIKTKIPPEQILRVAQGDHIYYSLSTSAMTLMDYLNRLAYPQRLQRGSVTFLDLKPHLIASALSELRISSIGVV